MQTHCFFLEGLEGGGFRCHWWLRGSAGAERPAAKTVWSATSSISLSRLQRGGDGKLGLQLLTNVAPAAGSDAITWQSPALLSNQPPPDAIFRGSPSLLKSALQKNVRLCRPGSAIRLGTDADEESTVNLKSVFMPYQVHRRPPWKASLNAARETAWHASNMQPVAMPSD